MEMKLMPVSFAVLRDLRSFSLALETLRHTLSLSLQVKTSVFLFWNLFLSVATTQE